MIVDEKLREYKDEELVLDDIQAEMINSFE
jgi:hypothetical protein